MKPLFDGEVRLVGVNPRIILEQVGHSETLIHFRTRECNVWEKILMEAVESIELNSCGEYTVRLDELTSGIIKVRQNLAERGSSADIGFDPIELLCAELRHTCPDSPDFNPHLQYD